MNDINSLSGKKIFLIIPYFHGYEMVIADEMKRQGIEVELMIYFGVKKSFFSSKSAAGIYYANFQSAITLKIKSHSFDYFFVINIDFIETDSIQLFKKKNPSASTIFYLWDSLVNLEKVRTGNIIEQYDYRFSFDYSDCINYPNFSLRHRPTFFHPYGSELLPPIKNDYDVATVMSAMPARIDFVNRLHNMYRNLSMNLYIHFPSVLTIPAYIINHGVKIKPKFIKWRKLTIFQTLELFNRSGCILDIPSYRQNGLTLRSHDALCMNKKLITTNQEIARYDFFNENNILVIHTGKMENVDSFLKTPVLPVAENIKIKYSIGFWVKSILMNLDVVYAK